MGRWTPARCLLDRFGLMIDRSWTLRVGARRDDGGRKCLQAELRRDSRVRTYVRRSIETASMGSCCAPESLGRRTKQKFSRGDSFDDTHGPTAEWATPGGTLSSWGNSLCRRCLFAGKT